MQGDVGGCRSRQYFSQLRCCELEDGILFLPLSHDFTVVLVKSLKLIFSTVTHFPCSENTNYVCFIFGEPALILVSDMQELSVLTAAPEVGGRNSLEAKV